MVTASANKSPCLADKTETGTDIACQANIFNFFGAWFGCHFNITTNTLNIIRLCLVCTVPHRQCLS